MLLPRFVRPLALAALLAGCGGGSGAQKVDAALIKSSDASDARADGGRVRDAAMEVRQARCCVLPTYASYSPYAGCNLLTLVPDATVDLIQACLDGDGGPAYGRWQCGGPNGQETWCSNAGLNCGLGDVCWVPSEDSSAGGCPGSVQACAYPWP